MAAAKKAKKTSPAPKKAPTAAERATAARAAALTLVDKINKGIASSLGFQGIVDLVGDELRGIFSKSDLSIRLVDLDARVMRFPYIYEKGRRMQLAPLPLQPEAKASKLRKAMQAKRVVLLRSREEMRAMGVGKPIPGTVPSRSMLAAPIVGASGVIGAIFLENYEHADAYDKDDARLLKTIGASLGVALENARLFEQTQRLLKDTEQRNAELAVINSIQQGIAASLDFQGIVDLVGDKVREVFKTGNMAIRWWDETSGLTHWLYAYEHGRRDTIAPTKPGPASNLLKAIRTREPVVVNQKGGRGKGVQGTDQPKSLLFVPILGSARVLGTIQLEDHERQGAFDESAVRLLSTVAASMGVALEIARNFAEMQRMLKETERRAAELAVINSIQQGIAASLDFQAIVDLVGDKLREVFHTGDIAIRWWDEATSTTTWLYSYEHGKRYAVEPTKLIEGGPTWLALTTRTPQLASPRQLEVGLIPGTDRSASMAVVPIVGSDRVLGTIQLEDHARENAFGDAEMRLLTTVAASMGVALESARNFAETQRLLKETAQRNAELAVINSIQQGVSENLDFQKIIDLVGDKLREVFGTGDISIRWWDRETNLIHQRYAYEHGVRLKDWTIPLRKGSLIERVLHERIVGVVNTVAEGDALGIKHVPGTDRSKSSVRVPIVAGDRALGYIMLENYEREHAFSDSDIRLLTTVANGMGVALENARLFKAEQERVAELAVINSIQE